MQCLVLPRVEAWGTGSTVSGIRTDFAANMKLKCQDNHTSREVNVTIRRSTSNPDASPHRSTYDATSSIRTDGTSDLPKRPTGTLVNAFYVGFVRGNALESAGVGLDGLG